MKKLPAYRTMYNSLREDILNKKYLKGDLLPPEGELCSLFSVSRTTVRKVISMLLKDGFIEVKQGKGTTILANEPTSQKLNKISSITESLKANGLTVKTKDMFIQRITPEDSIAKLFNLKKGENVYRLDRIQVANDIPIAIITNYLNANYIEGFEVFQNKFNSLYKFLENEYNIVLTQANEKITAKTATFTDAQILNINVGDPLIFTKRTSYLETKVFEVAFSKIVASRYEYEINLFGR